MLVEIMLPDDADALGRQRVAQVVILIVEVVIGLEPDGALVVQQILNLKITDEIGVAGTVSVITIAEVAVKQQPVIQQLARQRHIHLDIAEVAFVSTDVRRNG